MPPRPDRRPARPTAEEIRAFQERIEAQAKEVLEHLYQAVLKTPEFTLRDGTKCRVTPYVEPQVTDEGEALCGIDVQTADGHLDFTVRNTGSGQACAKVRAAPNPRRGRAR